MNTLLLITLLLTAFVLVLVPVYWKTYGPSNFLWLSDIGLFLTLIALWLHSSLLISIAAVLILPFELAWMFDYGWQITTRRNLLGVVGYMFNSEYPLAIRALSLFHIALPIIWFSTLYFWRYSPNALWLAILLVWIILPLTYFLTSEERNINWVHLPAYLHWRRVPGYLWLTLLMLGIPIFVILPMHLLLNYFFKG